MSKEHKHVPSQQWGEDLRLPRGKEGDFYYHNNVLAYNVLLFLLWLLKRKEGRFAYE